MNYFPPRARQLGGLHRRSGPHAGSGRTTFYILLWIDRGRWQDLCGYAPNPKWKKMGPTERVTFSFLFACSALVEERKGWWSTFSHGADKLVRGDDWAPQSTYLLGTSICMILDLRCYWSSFCFFWGGGFFVRIVSSYKCTIIPFIHWLVLREGFL